MYHLHIISTQRENLIPYFPDNDFQNIYSITPYNADSAIVTTLTITDDEICEMQTHSSYEDIFLKQCPRPSNVKYYQVPKHVYQMIEYGNKIVCCVDHDLFPSVIIYDHAFKNPKVLCNDVCTINIGDDNQLNCFPFGPSGTIKIFDEQFKQVKSIFCAIPLPHFLAKVISSTNETSDNYYVYSASTNQIHIIDEFGRESNIEPISNICSLDNSINERLQNVKAFVNLGCGCIIIINNFRKLLIIDPNNFTIIHLFELKYNASFAQVLSNSSFKVYYNNDGLVEEFELKDLPIMN